MYKNWTISPICFGSIFQTRLAFYKQYTLEKLSHSQKCPPFPHPYLHMDLQCITIFMGICNGAIEACNITLLTPELVSFVISLMLGDSDIVYVTGHCTFSCPYSMNRHWIRFIHVNNKNKLPM